MEVAGVKLKNICLYRPQIAAPPETMGTERSSVGRTPGKTSKAQTEKRTLGTVQSVVSVGCKSSSDKGWLYCRLVPTGITRVLFKDSVIVVSAAQSVNINHNIERWYRPSRHSKHLISDVLTQNSSIGASLFEGSACGTQCGPIVPPHARVCVCEVKAWNAAPVALIVVCPHGMCVLTQKRTHLFKSSTA